MNKDLIRRFKDEFDHWLYGGQLLHKDEFNNWENSRNIWDLKTESIKAIVKKDEYVEFRKALAEGKTIQYYVDGFVGWQDVKSVEQDYKHPNSFRIKPEEPKFKVGDWVVHPDVDVPWQITQNTIDHLDNSELKLWQPKPGEWCWVYDSAVDIPNLRKFVCFNNDSNVYQENNLNEPLKYIVEKYPGRGTIAYRYIEPFIGSLPSTIKI